MNSEFTSIPRLALVERDSRHKCRGQKELRRYELMSNVADFSRIPPFRPHFGAFYPIRLTNQRQERNGRPTVWQPRNLVGPQRPSGQWSPSPPHALRRQASGVRSCADPPPLAAARHRQPNWQRPNGARSRRSAPPCLVCHQTGRSLRANQTFPPRSPPDNG